MRMPPSYSEFAAGGVRGSPILRLTRLHFHAQSAAAHVNVAPSLGKVKRAASEKIQQRKLIGSA